MAIFLEVVFPVLLIFLSGYAIQKWKRVDLKALTTLTIYIFIPMLVFQTFYRAELDKEYANLFLFSTILLFILIALTKIYVKIRGFNQSVESGLILATAFMNSGNFGAPIILFAYGEKAFTYAVTILVLHTIFMNFFGVYYAAKGEAGIKTAFKAVLGMPSTYAVILALILNLGNIAVPESLLSSIDLVGSATIPLIMVVLGMQLAEINLSSLEWEKISYGVVVRLFLSPLLAVAIIYFIPMDPILEKVLILTSAMPSAANTVIYAVQFDTEAELVSSTTLVTTLVSIFTVTIMLIILG